MWWCSIGIQPNPVTLENLPPAAGSTAPAERPDAGHQLHVRERLGQVIVRAEVKAGDPVRQRAGCGEHQDPSGMTGRDESTTHGVTVQDGKIPVQHHHIDVRGAEQGQGTGSVTRHVDPETLMAQPVGQHLREIDLVLHDQQPHVGPLSSAIAHIPSLGCPACSLSG